MRAPPKEAAQPQDGGDNVQVSPEPNFGTPPVNLFAGIGVKIPDKEIAEHILTALPELYEPFVSSLAIWSETPTLSELTT